MIPWKKTETENGIPLYINENTNEKRWDHPRFAGLRQKLDDCNYVKYSSYRVALKFRVLQQALFMDRVSLVTISGVFERHRLGTCEGSLCLDSYDLEAVLSDIYFASNKQNKSNLDVDLATDLMLNLLSNIYDSSRNGKIQVLSTKVLLGILCNSNFMDLNRFLFGLCADHNNCITRLKLQVLLHRITTITTFMHEDANFGQHLIHMSIENCFLNTPGLVGINESSFLTWIEKGPQLLAWLSILHRLKSAETVVHTNKCSSCKITPFIGLKYQCMKCSKFIQCQRCFFSGRMSRTHKLSHSMREYCSEINARENNYLFMKRIVSLLTCYPTTEEQISIIETKPLSTENHMLYNAINETVLCNIEPLSSPLSQLQIIIRQLELQNRELHHILSTGTRSEKDIKLYLEHHRIHVATQIHKLKLLKDYFKIPCETPRQQNLDKTKFHSTPMVNAMKNKCRRNGLEMLSPIVQMPENSSILPFSSTKLTTTDPNATGEHSSLYNVNDISTWMGGTTSDPQNCWKSDKKNKTPDQEIHSDLDDALAKLQQILANNFSLDESLTNIDNGQLQNAVSEVEGMLSSFIDTVESSRANSTQPQPYSLRHLTNVNSDC